MRQVIAVSLYSLCTPSEYYATPLLTRQEPCGCFRSECLIGDKPAASKLELGPDPLKNGSLYCKLFA